MSSTPKRLSSDAALVRVREVCFSFAGVQEKLSHGAPTFFVRGKSFLMFADDHHGDGRMAAWCKADFERQRGLVDEAPERYFVPPYLGVRGWVGVRLDAPEMDWDALVFIVEQGWASVAPKAVQSQRPSPPPPSAPRPKTDPALLEKVYARLATLCEALTDVSVEREKWSATFRTNNKPFAYFYDNHHGDGIIGAWVRVGPGENAALAAAEPERYFVPPYLGPRGWVGVRLDGKRVDWQDVAARVAASHASVARQPRVLRAVTVKASSRRPTRPK